VHFSIAFNILAQSQGDAMSEPQESAQQILESELCFDGRGGTLDEKVKTAYATCLGNKPMDGEEPTSRHGRGTRNQQYLHDTNLTYIKVIISTNMRSTPKKFENFCIA